jgi:hypothetical protein
MTFTPAPTTPSPRRLILPKINWSTAASFSQTAANQPVGITAPAKPGLDVQMSASASALSPATGTLPVTQLSAALSAQHMSKGVSTGMFLYYIAGTRLSASVQLTLANNEGFMPGVLFADETGRLRADRRAR